MHLVQLRNPYSCLGFGACMVGLLGLVLLLFYMVTFLFCCCLGCYLVFLRGSALALPI